MAKISIKAGTTSKLLDLFVSDSSSTVGAGLTGVAFNTSGLTAYYYREGAASAVAITLATMTLGTWATGGFIVIDGTNMPGTYQLGIPDAAIASGAKSVIVYLKGVTNMAALVLEVELTTTDNQDAITGGMSGIAVMTSGTAQAGAATSITLAAGASATNGLYDPGVILLTGGTGAGQARNILDYVGSTKVATVDKAWRTNPDNTTTYVISPGAYSPSVNEGIAAAGAGSTITLNSSASAVDSTYNGQWVFIRAGTGTDQARMITGYVGSTKVATVSHAWQTNPDSTSIYVVLPAARVQGVEGNVTGSVASVTGAVGSVTGLTASNLDTTVSSRMATYTQPTGFLAATFPTGTVANTTNITAGTITTVTNLTNAATAGDLTATMKTSVQTAADAAVTANASVVGIKAKTDNLPASPAAVGSAMTLTSGERTSIGDALLDRDMATGTDSGGRTVRNALRFLRNKWSISGTTLTVTKEDDTTSAWTSVVTAAPGADPISGSDPV